MKKCCCLQVIKNAVADFTWENLWVKKMTFHNGHWPTKSVKVTKHRWEVGMVSWVAKSMWEGTQNVAT